MTMTADQMVVEIIPNVAGLVAHVVAMRSAPPMVTYIHVPFAEGVYRFALGRKEVTELERACGYQDKRGDHQPLGIGGIYARLARGRAFLPDGSVDWQNMSVGEALASEIVERDCLEVVRLSLIGGGEGLVDGERVQVSPSRAKQLLDTYVVGQPLESAWTYAFAILSARISGVAPNGFADEPALDDADEAAA